MAKYCSDCTYYNTSKTKNGNKGCCLCSKSNKHILGNTYACNNFSNAYARGWYEKESIYDEAKKIEHSTSNEISPIVPVILIILLIILKILKIV